MDPNFASIFSDKTEDGEYNRYRGRCDGETLNRRYCVCHRPGEPIEIYTCELRLSMYFCICCHDLSLLLDCPSFLEPCWLLVVFFHLHFTFPVYLSASLLASLVFCLCACHCFFFLSSSQFSTHSLLVLVFHQGKIRRSVQVGENEIKCLFAINVDKMA